MFALLVLELIGGLPKRLLRANVEVVRRARVHKLRPDTFDGHLGQHAENVKVKWETSVGNIYQ